MKRMLVNLWGDENNDLNFAVIALEPHQARWWLEKVKPDVDALHAKYGHDFATIELWNWQPDFIRFSGCYTDVLPEDLVDEIENDEFAWLPEDLALVDPDIELARMELIVGCADETGVHWRGREKHAPFEVETPRLTWEILESIAAEVPPTDNSGRAHCWWCGRPTEEEALFTSVTRKCSACGK